MARYRIVQEKEEFIIEKYLWPFGYIIRWGDVDSGFHLTFETAEEAEKYIYEEFVGNKSNKINIIKEIQI